MSGDQTKCFIVRKILTGEVQHLSYSSLFSLSFLHTLYTGYNCKMPALFT